MGVTKTCAILCQQAVCSPFAVLSQKNLFLLIQFVHQSEERRVRSVREWKVVLEDLVNGLLEHFHIQYRLTPLLP